jgi:RNA polymerase sigma-70 factor (ECF subfamily)
VNDQAADKGAEMALVKKVLEGDKNAFGEIIRNTEGLVRQIVYKMITNTEDRKDMEQETYFRVYKNLGSFERRSRLSTWIAKIAYNACVNYLSKKKLVLTDNEDYLIKSEEETEPLIFSKQLSAILAREIEMLTPLYRILIILYHQEDLSYADIAQITGLPEGTVKNYLFRARKMLRENILKQYKKEQL